MPDNQPGLLIVGHGTRHKEGRQEFLQTAALVRSSLPQIAIEPAFLELANPTIEEGLGRLAGQGVKSVIIAPLLLFKAGHAQEDIPSLVAEAALQFGLRIVGQSEPLECQAELLQLSAEQFQQAQRELPVDRSTGWLLVARGSSDAAALAKVQEFLELRRRLTPVEFALACYVAVAQPSLPEAIEHCAAQPVSRMVVQPHLLFSGQVLETVSQAVQLARQRYPQKQWLLAPHLGPSPRIAAALAARISDLGKSI